jgi:hypothetical protein
MCDNTSVISVVKNLVFYKRMRQLERRHHFLKDHLEKEDIEMRYINIERQLTNILTIPLDFSRFADLRGGGDCCFTSVWLLRGGWCFILYIFLFSCIFFILT